MANLTVAMRAVDDPVWAFTTLTWAHEDRAPAITPTGLGKAERRRRGGARFVPHLRLFFTRSKRAMGVRRRADLRGGAGAQHVRALVPAILH
jgi:hypothetical protein